MIYFIIWGVGALITFALLTATLFDEDEEGDPEDYIAMAVGSAIWMIWTPFAFAGFVGYQIRKMVIQSRKSVD